MQFALRWFEEWSGGQDFERWMSSLPAPLSPLVLRGARLNRESRLRAGQSSGFLDALERWAPEG